MFYAEPQRAARAGAGGAGPAGNVSWSGSTISLTSSAASNRAGDARSFAEEEVSLSELLDKASEASDLLRRKIGAVRGYTESPFRGRDVRSPSAALHSPLAVSTPASFEDRLARDPSQPPRELAEELEVTRRKNTALVKELHVFEARVADTTSRVTSLEMVLLVTRREALSLRMEADLAYEAMTKLEAAVVAASGPAGGGADARALALQNELGRVTAERQSLRQTLSFERAARLKLEAAMRKASHLRGDVGALLSAHLSTSDENISLRERVSVLEASLSDICDAMESPPRAETEADAEAAALAAGMVTPMGEAARKAALQSRIRQMEVENQRLTAELQRSTSKRLGLEGALASERLALSQSGSFVGGGGGGGGAGDFPVPSYAGTLVAQFQQQQLRHELGGPALDPELSARVLAAMLASDDVIRGLATRLSETESLAAELDAENAALRDRSALSGALHASHDSHDSRAFGGTERVAKQLAFSESKGSALEAQNATLRERLQMAAADHLRLKSEIRSLSSQLEGAKIEAKSANVELRGLHGELQAARAALQDAYTARDFMLRELGTAREDRDRMAADLAVVHGRMERAQGVSTVHESKLSDTIFSEGSDSSPIAAAAVASGPTPQQQQQHRHSPAGEGVGGSSPGENSAAPAFPMVTPHGRMHRAQYQDRVRSATNALKQLQEQLAAMSGALDDK